ncbi:MAG: hypothetical protein RAK18_01455 [Conexivisphaerales archaeon]|nr:hypothetical protein [Conexivisphaerales archaeon]
MPPRDPARLQPGEWTRIDRKLFELAMDARLSEAEEKARGATGHILDSVQGLDLKLMRFSKDLRLLPRELEDDFSLLIPQGIIYGLEAVAVAGEEEVPLGAILVVGMYDEGSGEGVVFGDEWLDAQLGEMGDLLRSAARQLGLPDA